MQKHISPELKIAAAIRNLFKNCSGENSHEISLLTNGCTSSNPDLVLDSHIGYSDYLHVMYL